MAAKSEYDEEISDKDKVKIVSDFILHAPPGEFNEVFNDVRVLLGNDTLLKEGASGAFAKYNQDQFTPCTLEGTGDKTLITAHGLQPDGRYLDPRSKQTFAFDHLRKEATALAPAPADEDAESLRAEFERVATEYTSEHYPSGVCSVYAKKDTIIVCIEDHKFQPKNFWNGRWRSQWTFNKRTGAAQGLLRVQVHYYEDGNVQLSSEKTVDIEVPVSDDAATAKKFVKMVTDAEQEYQSAISANYVTMSDTTFKALRRALPITRTKVEWTKILNYKLGKELAK